MLTAPTPPPIFEPAAIPLALTAASAEAMAEGMRASLQAWSAMAQTCTEASRAYAELLSRTMMFDWPRGFSAPEGADALLKTQLAASEAAAERLVTVAEEALAASVGRCVPLPD